MNDQTVAQKDNEDSNLNLEGVNDIRQEPFVCSLEFG